MMLEQQSMEQAELYALGLLDETDIRGFERELSRDADLQQYLQELEDTMAAIALTAPPQSPTAGTFEKIQAKVDRQILPLEKSRLVKLPIPIWAAAALVLLSTLTVHQVVSSQSRKAEIVKLREALEAERQGNENRLGGEGRRNKSFVHSSSEPGSFTQEGYEFSGNYSQVPTYTLVQNLTKLEKQLSKLQKIHDERFLQRSGVSRMVVMEMLDPTLASEEKEARRLQLSDKVGEILKTGLDDSKEDTEEKKISTVPEGPLHLSGTDHRKGGDIVIESGMVNLEFLQLLEENTTITHKDFPKEEVDAKKFRGIKAREGGAYYDKFNNILWEPQEDGTYQGRRPGEDGVPPALPDPPVVPEVEEEPASPSDQETTEAKAYTIFDETTGEGRMVVSGVPATGEGEIYQFWMTEPGENEVISIGVIENFQGGSGLLEYTLPQLGISPSNYFITIESAGGSDSPSSNVVLVGP